MPVAVDLTDKITKTIATLARRQLECSIIWTTMEHVTRADMHYTGGRIKRNANRTYLIPC